MVVLEAMSAGLPVIATAIPVFREYVTDRRDALLVPPADADALAGAMLEMAGDEGLRRYLTENRRPAAARFTWQTSARRHMEIYDEVAAPR